MGHFTRPPVEVLDDAALIPAKNLIVPSPNQFTHVTVGDRPFFFEHPNSGTAAGTFPAGTQVVLLVLEPVGWCRVVDGRGLYVVTELSGLAPLEINVP